MRSRFYINDSSQSNPLKFTQANRSGEGAMAAGTGMTQMFWFRLCCRCPGHGPNLDCFFYYYYGTNKNFRRILEWKAFKYSIFWGGTPEIHFLKTKFFRYFVPRLQKYLLKLILRKVSQNQPKKKNYSLILI